MKNAINTKEIDIDELRNIIIIAQCLIDRKINLRKATILKKTFYNKLKSLEDRLVNLESNK